MSRMSPLNVRAAGAGARRDPRTAGPAAGGRRGAGGRIPTRRPPRGRASSASAGTTTAVRGAARVGSSGRASSRARRSNCALAPAARLRFWGADFSHFMEGTSCGRLVGRYN